MKKSVKKLNSMIKNSELKKTINKIMKANSPEEIIELAKKDQVDISLEEAEMIYKAKGSKKEISNDILKDIKKELEEK